MHHTSESPLKQIKLGDAPKKEGPNHYAYGATERKDIWNSRASPEGKLAANTETLRVILHKDPALCRAFYYSEVYGAVRVRHSIPAGTSGKDIPGGRALADEDTTSVRIFLSAVYRKEYTKTAVEEMIRFTARGCVVNEISEYLCALAWDGVARVDAALTRYAGVEASDYARAASRIFFLSAAARGLKPGTKADTALILHGAQGAGKSTLIRSLFGGAWSMDSPLEIGSKEALQLIKGKWCVELAELASLTKKEVEPVKAFLSGHADDFRPPYGREPVTFLRTAVFIGTTNDKFALKDSTGSRRFFPVTVGRIDNAALAWDRDQLWAEAAHRVRAGEPHWPSEADAASAAIAGEDHTARHPWHEVVARWTEGIKDTGLELPYWGPQGKPFSLDKVMREAVEFPGAYHHNDANARVVRDILTSLGFEPRRAAKENGHRPWKWQRKE